MRLDFYTLDVFTDRRFGGNPLAVVMGGDDLDGATMQTIAREFNLSETVFVLRPQNPAHSARVRIFTPTAELPFAGHPTVGTGVLLAALRTAGLGGSQDAIIALEETIGLVRVGVRVREGQAPFAEFDAPKLPEETGAVPSVDDLAVAIGLIPSEIGFENHKPTSFSAGLPFVFVPVRSLDAIQRARAALGPWDKAVGANTALYVYCRETLHKTAHFHARMFGPGMGMMEDPATGSAAAAFSAVIARFDEPPGGEHRYVIEQGYEMGRPSQINLTVEMDGGRPKNVRIGGSAVRVSEGKLEV